MPPGVAIRRRLLLHRARRRRADLPFTGRPAAELSWCTSRERRRLPCGNRVGTDAWSHVIEAGFGECRIVAAEYHSALAFTAVR